jgi:predicted nucleic acid-binding Zn ribbon protein
VRRRAPRPLSAALETLSAQLAPATPLASAQAVWASVVGPAIAAHAVPTDARGGALHVRCDESVWAAELELMGPDLVAALRAATGSDAITSLRCRTGPV